MVPHSYIGKPSFHKITIEVPDVDSLKLLVAVAAQTLSCDARVYLTGAREEIIAYHIL